MLCVLFMCASMYHVAVAILTFIKHQPGARSAHLKFIWEYAFLSLSCGFCSRWTRQKFTYLHCPLPTSIFLCIAFLIHTIRIFLFNTHVSLPWPLEQDFPLGLRIEDPHFLINDFYVNAASSSIRLGVPLLVFALKYIGLNIHSIGLILSFLLQTLLPSFQTWFVLSFCELSSQNKKTPAWIGLTICGITNINFENGFTAYPLGWQTIQELALSVAGAHYIFAMIYLFLMHVKNKYFLSGFICFFITLIHPLMSIFMFIFSILLSYVSDKSLFETIKNHLSSFILLNVVLICFLLFSNPKNPVDTKIFVHAYVFLFHPIHYLMSQTITLKTISLWLLSAVGAAFIFAFLSKNTKSYKLFFSILILLFCAVSTQFIGTEIFPNKFIANLGPSRMSLFWSISYHIIIVYFLHSLDKQITTCKSNLFLRPLWIFSICTIISVCIFYTRYSFEEINKNDFGESILWIKKNSMKEDILMIHLGKDITLKYAYAIRLIAERAVYVDETWSFNEDAIPEHLRRREIQIKTIATSYPNLLKTSQQEQISYLYTNKPLKDAPSEALVFHNTSYFIYRLKPL